MAGATVQFVISVDGAGAVTGINAVNSSMQKLGPTTDEQVTQSTTAFDRLEATLNKMQSAVTGFIAAWVFREAIRGIGDIIEAGIAFESSFARVTTTVQGSTESLKALSDQMIEMSKTIPESVDNLNAIATQAGRLGASVNDIHDFVQTIAEMGVITGSSTEEMSLGFGKLVTALGLPLSAVKDLGSMMVDLSTKSAASVEQILTFSTRLAGIATEVGLTTPQVAALAATMSSVGLQSERSGSAVIKLMSDMGRAIEGNGRILQNFAAISGMSGDAFKKAFQEDAGGALLSFITGLNNAHEAGQSTVSMLDSVGEKNIRLTDVLLKVSGALGTYSKNVQTATDDMNNSGAAMDSLYKKMSNTPAAQLQEVQNRIHAVYIAISTEMLPSLIDAAKQFASIIEWLNASKTAFEAAAIAIAAVGIALAGIKIGQTIIETLAFKDAVFAVQDVMGTAATATEGLSFALGPAGLGAQFVAISLTLGYVIDRLKNYYDDLDKIKEATENAKSATEQQTTNIMKAVAAYAQHGIVIATQGRDLDQITNSLKIMQPELLANIAAEKEATATKEKHTAALNLLTAAQEKAAAKFAESVAWTTDDSKATKELNEQLGYALGMGVSYAAMVDAKGAQIKKEIQLEKDELGSLSGLMQALDDYITKKKEATKETTLEATELEKEMAALDKYLGRIADGVAAVDEANKKDKEMLVILGTLLDKQEPLNAIMDVYGGKIASLIKLEEARGKGLSAQLQPFADLIHAQQDMNGALSQAATNIAGVIAAVKAGTITAQQGMNQMPNGWQGPLQAGIYQGGMPMPGSQTPARQAEAATLAMQNKIFASMSSQLNTLWTKFMETGKMTLADVGKALGAVFVTVTSGLMTIFEKGLLSPLSDLIGKGAVAISKTLTDTIQGALGSGGFSKAISGILGGVLGAGIGAAVGALVGWVSSLFGAGKAAENDVVQQIQNPFAKAVENLIGSFNALNAAGTQTLVTAAATRDSLQALWAQFQTDMTTAAKKSGAEATAVAQGMATITSVWGPGLSKLFDSINSTITDLGGTANMTSQQITELNAQLTAALAAVTAFNNAVDSIVKSVTAASDNSDVMEAALQKLIDAGTPTSLIVATLGNQIAAMATQMQTLGIVVPPLIAQFNALSQAALALAANVAKQQSVETQLASVRTQLATAISGAITSNEQEIMSYAANIDTWTTSIATFNASITASQKQLDDTTTWIAQYNQAIAASTSAYQAAVTARQNTETQIASLTTSLHQATLQSTLDTANAALTAEKNAAAATKAAAVQSLTNQIAANDANARLSLEARALQHTFLQQQLTDLQQNNNQVLSSQSAVDAAQQAMNDYNNAQKLQAIVDQQTALDNLKKTLLDQIATENALQQASLDAQAAANKTIDDQKAALRDSITSAQQQVAALQQNIAMANAHISALEQENAAYRALQQILGVTNATVMGTIEDLTAQIGALEAQRDALSALTGVAAETPNVFNQLSSSLTMLALAAAQAMNSINSSVTSISTASSAAQAAAASAAFAAQQAAATAAQAAASKQTIQTLPAGSTAIPATLTTFASSVPSGATIAQQSNFSPQYYALLAAATTGTDSVPSYAVGTPSVPYDMIARIHRGERIVPAAQNMNGGSTGATDNSITFSAGSIVINPQPGQSGRSIAQQFVSELTTNGTLRSKLKQIVGNNR